MSVAQQVAQRLLIEAHVPRDVGTAERVKRKGAAASGFSFF